MVTYDGTSFREKKDNGLVKDVFDKAAMDSVGAGSVGIGHVRQGRGPPRAPPGQGAPATSQDAIPPRDEGSKRVA